MLTETQIDRLIKLDPDATIKVAHKMEGLELDFLERVGIIKGKASLLERQEAMTPKLQGAETIAAVKVFIEKPRYQLYKKPEIIPVLKTPNKKQLVYNVYTTEVYDSINIAAKETGFSRSKIQSDLDNIFSKGVYKPLFKWIKNET